MAEYKSFKMKGHTLPGINQRSEGDTDTPEGRSASSAFQYKSPAKDTQTKTVNDPNTGTTRETQVEHTHDESPAKQGSPGFNPKKETERKAGEVKKRKKEKGSTEPWKNPGYYPKSKQKPDSGPQPQKKTAKDLWIENNPKKPMKPMGKEGPPKPNLMEEYGG